MSLPLCFASAGCLQTLVIPESRITDDIAEEITGRLSSLTFVDVSHCFLLGHRGIEAIGNNCKLLKGLCRRMPDPMVDSDYEVNAIASTMPNLKHLDLFGHGLTTKCVSKILGGCPKLEYLSIYMGIL